MQRLAPNVYCAAVTVAACFALFVFGPLFLLAHSVDNTTLADLFSDAVLWSNAEEKIYFSPLFVFVCLFAKTQTHGCIWEQCTSRHLTAPALNRLFQARFTAFFIYFFFVVLWIATVFRVAFVCIVRVSRLFFTFSFFLSFFLQFSRWSNLKRKRFRDFLVFCFVLDFAFYLSLLLALGSVTEL